MLHVLTACLLPCLRLYLCCPVVMSANEQKDTVFQAIKGGAEEYLVKPVTKKEVQNIWQYVWKRLQAAQLQAEVAQLQADAMPPQQQQQQAAALPQVGYSWERAFSPNAGLYEVFATTCMHCCKQNVFSW